MELMENGALRVNPGKKEIVESSSGNYFCYAIKTKLVTCEDKLADVIETYAKPHLQAGDVLFISEKMVACTQGRALPLADIKPGFFARLLSRFVMKTPAGIGLGMPETMQCAIDECGLFRILLASVAGAFAKLFRRRGWFYAVAGYRAACIDGPCDYTLPPYNEYVVLAPAEPDKTARDIADMLDGVTVLIIDVNDLSGEILGASEQIDRAEIIKLLRQNPLGQSTESTPMGILRREL